MDELYLGIDTSNYRTSCALVDASGRIVFNHRELLPVPEGKRGLRQSEAFFSHVQRLPDIICDAMQYRAQIRGISVSSRPRPREGSYMPCFTAGLTCARELSAALDVPLIETSHQEGHIEAVRYYSKLKDNEDLIFFHFSGGTTEAVYNNEIVGGTLDIALGQVLDRLGVSLGMAFPSGEEMDRRALQAPGSTNCLKAIKVKDGFMNLSGIETQSMRKAEEMVSAGEDTDPLIREVFDRLGSAIGDMASQLMDKYDTRAFLFAGGVSSSEYLKQYLSDRFSDNTALVFGAPELSGDNAVGTALIGMKKLTKR